MMAIIVVWSIDGICLLFQLSHQPQKYDRTSCLSTPPTLPELIASLPTEGTWSILDSEWQVSASLQPRSEVIHEYDFDEVRLAPLSHPSDFESSLINLLNDIGRPKHTSNAVKRYEWNDKLLSVIANVAENHGSKRLVSFKCRIALEENQYLFLNAVRSGFTSDANLQNDDKMTQRDDNDRSRTLPRKTTSLKKSHPPMKAMHRDHFLDLSLRRVEGRVSHVCSCVDKTGKLRLEVVSTKMAMNQIVDDLQATSPDSTVHSKGDSFAELTCTLNECPTRVAIWNDLNSFSRYILILPIQ